MKKSLCLAFIIAASSLVMAQGTCANFVGGTCPAAVPSGVTHFYFIDYVSGSDSNTGASETAAFQHLPCSANATSNAAAACTSASGTGWILKGGVTLDYHSWPANVPYGGTSAAPTYLGVDPGWYTGSSWARPIFSGGGSSGYDASTQGLLTDYSHHTSYFVLDNIEFTGLYWTSTSGNSSPYAFIYAGSYSWLADSNWEAKNLYVHGWSHAAGAYDPAGYQRLISLPQGGTTYSALSSVHDSVFDGSDSSQDCCGAIYAGHVYNNYIQYLVDAFNSPLVTNGLILFHDNTVHHEVLSSTGVHENCFQVYAYNGVQSGGSAIAYNNYLDCKDIGTSAEGLFFETIGATNYAFNNMVLFGQPAGVSLGGWSATTASNTFYVFNNSVQAYNAAGTSTNTCFTPNFNTVTFMSGNFCVTNNGNAASFVVYQQQSGYSTTFVGPTFSITCNGGAQTNLGMSQICAPIGTGNGTGNLNQTETYPFAPLDSTASGTVGTGPNNSTYCPALSSLYSGAGTACLSDTTLGVSYNTLTHTVSYPARTAIARPTGGSAWQNGAYQYASGTNYTLTVSITGTGSVAGGSISCPGTCSETVSSGTQVTLTATPGSGSTFSGWSGGGCSGTGSCIVTVNSNTTVTAPFTATGTTTVFPARALFTRLWDAEVNELGQWIR